MIDELNYCGGNIFPSLGRLIFLYAYRPNELVDETANATIAPGPTTNAQADPVDINGFRIAHSHFHKGVVRQNVKQMCVALCGKIT